MADISWHTDLAEYVADALRVPAKVEQMGGNVMAVVATFREHDVAVVDAGSGTLPDQAGHVERWGAAAAADGTSAVDVPGAEADDADVSFAGAVRAVQRAHDLGVAHGIVTAASRVRQHLDQPHRRNGPDGPDGPGVDGP